MADISRRIFGADFNEDVKKVLETRQALAKEAQPLESIENHSENYKSNFIDGDQKILSDLGSRTPFCRMWTAVQIQKHTLVETIDNSEGDFNIKEADEKDKEQGIEKTRAVLNSFKASRTNFNGAYFSKGADNPYHMDDGKGGKEDISWLL